MEEIVKVYVERSLLNKYVTNCPEDRPFYIGQVCKDCGKN